MGRRFVQSIARQRSSSCLISAILLLSGVVALPKRGHLQAFSESSSHGLQRGSAIEASLASGGLGLGQEDALQNALYAHPGGKAAVKPSRDDFVIAIPTHSKQESRVFASRAARLGITTYVATNYSQGLDSAGPVRYPAGANETWGFYADDKPARSYSPGDSRAAMVPFLAFKELGDTFKWLFLGDDDTLFFVDSARIAVKDLDADMPYFITDNAWFTCKKGTFPPHKQAPRCVPCNYARNITQLPMNMTRGCPCTPTVMCALEGGYNGILNPRACGPPRAPSMTYSMHGGSGALISIGLLRQISFDDMEQCIGSEWNSGADGYLTVCLWKMGFAMTDIDPLWHPEGQVMFDPTPEPYNTDENMVTKAAYVLGNMLRVAAGSCNGLCELEMNRTVSLHIRAQKVGKEEEMTQPVLRAIARLYGMNVGLLKADQLADIQDMDGRNATMVAAAVEKRFAAGKDFVAGLQGLFQEGTQLSTDIAERVEPLLTATSCQQVGIIDKARSGAAMAVAKQVLDLAMQDAQKLLTITQKLALS